MSNRRGRRVETTDRACLECQRRKTRCTLREGQDVCTYCSRSGKTCVIGERSAGTALTRRNLDAAEARCRQLEDQLASLISKPDVVGSTQMQPSELDQPAVGGLADLECINEMQHDQIQVAHDSYDWQEDTGLENVHQIPTIKDGAPSAETRTGYYGPSSASTLLESLSSVLSPDSNTSPSAATNAACASSKVPRSTAITPGLVYMGGITSTFIHAHYVDTYFLAYNSSYPILHERSFRNQLRKNSERPTHSIFQIISYMVLAIGEWISGHASGDHSVYYDAARSRLKFEILETGNTSVVQAFLLLGNYLQKRDRPNTAYNFIGIAYRVALGLGLHREPRSASGAHQFLVEKRRQLFWTLYCFDSGFSLTTGRPTLISDAFIDTKKPKNVDDSLNEIEHSDIREVDYPTTCSAIIAQARLAVIANKIHNNLLSVRSYYEVDDVTTSMEQSISNWRSSLPVFFFRADVPQWFLGPRQIVLWKEANLRIILLLASQRHARDDEDKVLIGARCQSIAVATILDMTEFCKHNIELIHVGINWYVVYFLLHAVLAMAFQRSFEEKRSGSRIMIQDKVPVRSAWDDTISQARQCLEILSSSNKAAIRTLQILDRLQESFAVMSHPDGSSSNTKVSQQAKYHDGKPQNMTAASNFAVEDGYSRAQSMLPPIMPSGVSPDVLLIDSVMGDLLGTADPSLHMYLNDETVSLDAVFQGFHGFPSVMEPENFAYTTDMMHGNRTSS